MTISPRPRRLGGLAAATVAVALATSACSFVSPRETTNVYPPSDGTPATLSLTDGTSVDLLNMLVVADAEGAPGRVVGALQTTASEPVTVSLTAEFAGETPSAPVDVEVRPNELTILGGENGEDVVLPSVGAAPGAFITMTASTPDAGTVEWQVPVFPPVYPYEGLAPTAAPTDPAATPAPTATP